jgi:primosomal protein N'
MENVKKTFGIIVLTIIIVFSMAGCSVNCPACSGTGKCSNCDGTGKSTYFYNNSPLDCSACGGTGKCRECNGTGKVSGLE